MVGADTELESVSGEGGHLGSRKVDGGIADQDIERPTGAPEIVDELADAVERGEVEVHHGVIFLAHADRFGGLFGLEKISTGHYHVPFAALG